MVEAHDYGLVIAMTNFDKKTHMNQLMEQSTIREKIDTDIVSQLMIDIRKKQLGDF